MGLQLLNFFFELIDSVFVDLSRLKRYLFSKGLLFLEFVLYLLDFLLLDDIGLMQFSDLLLLFIDTFNLLFGFMGQLLKFLFHSSYFVHSFLILIIFYGLVLGFSDLLQSLLLFLKCLQLFFEMLKLIFLFDYLIDIIFAV